MGKRTDHTKDLFGPDLYSYYGVPIRSYSIFLYEISIYKYWKDNFELLSKRILKVEGPLSIKIHNKIEYHKDYVIEKEITLLAAPIDFIRDLNLPIWIKKCRKCHKK